MSKINDRIFELGSIQKDFQGLRDEVNEMFKHIKTDARHGLQDAVIGVNKGMHRLFPKSSIKNNDPINFIKKEMRENPISSALILLTVGFIGAKILANKS